MYCFNALLNEKKPSSMVVALSTISIIENVIV